MFIDFDGVMVDTVEAIVDLYNEDFRYYSKFEEIHWKDINTWDFKECNCASKEYIDTYFNQQRFFDRLINMPGVRLAINELWDKYDITVVSHGYSPNLRLKQIWLENHYPGIKFEGINLKQYSDKSHIDMRGGVFIDDSSRNLITSNADVKICFGDLRSWNECWGGLRAKHWMEVMDMIKEMEYEESLWDK